MLGVAQDGSDIGVSLQGLKSVCSGGVFSVLLRFHLLVTARNQALLRRGMVDREKGSNALRGGKNIYAAKTRWATGSRKSTNPCTYARLSTRRFVTTTVHQQLDGCGRSTTEVEGFGAASCPKPVRFNYKDIIKLDTTATGAPWETVTKSVHVKPKEGSQTEFSTTFKLRGGLPDREALAKYREEWTSDTPLGASMRFKTSAAEGQSGTPAQFRAQTLRKLPGTPLAVERLRSKLIDTVASVPSWRSRSAFES